MNGEQLDCEIVRDLLPAYAGQSAGAKSSALVEAHLQSCDACREELENLREGDAQALRIGREVLEKINKRHSKQYRRGVLRAALISLAAVIAAAALLFGLRVPVTLTSDDIELRNDYSWASGDGGVGAADWRGLSRGFHMEYHHKPWTPFMNEWSNAHYDDATGTQTEYTFYNIAPRLVDVLLSPFTAGAYPRMIGYSRDEPIAQDEDGQWQPKYPNVVWKVYYYQRRDEDVLRRSVFPEGYGGPRESLLDSEGNLKPEVAEVATLLWEGPVEDWELIG
jgi:hypothetical protein